MDFVKLSVAILFFLYICEHPGEVNKFKHLLSLIRPSMTSSSSLSDFTQCWMTMETKTFVTKTMLDVVKAIVADNPEDIFRLAKSGVGQVLNTTFSNECNLEKIFAQGLTSSSSSKSIVMKVRSAIPVFEIINDFARRQRLDVPLIFDTEDCREEHFWSVSNFASIFLSLPIMIPILRQTFSNSYYNRVASVT